METNTSLNSVKILMNEPIISSIFANESTNRTTFIQTANDLIKNLSENLTDENFQSNQIIWNRITVNQLNVFFNIPYLVFK